MTARSLVEVQADVDRALNINDAAALAQYATELEHHGSPDAQALLARVRGTLSRLHSAYSDALEQYNIALRSYRERDDRHGIARTTLDIGIVLYHTGDLDRALASYTAAQMLYEELGDFNAASGILSSIGTIHAATGNNPAALECYQRALEHSDADANKSKNAVVTSNIGGVYFDTGDYTKALEYFQRARDLHEELGDRTGIADDMLNIGSVYASMQDHLRAQESYTHAINLYEEVGNRSGVAMTTSNIGISYFDSHRYEDALHQFRRAYALHDTLGDRSGIARDLADIITTLLSLEKHVEAEQLLVTLDSMEIQNPVVVIYRERARATIQAHHGSTDTALQILRTAVELAQKHELPAMLVDVHRQIREVCRIARDLRGYDEHNSEFIRLTEEIRGRDVASRMALLEASRKYALERKEREQQLAVLHSALPRHIVDRIIRGETVNDHHAVAAVLFIDVVTFTAHSSALEVDALLELLERLFTSFDAIAKRHHIMKIKTIGDCYMAVAFPTDVPEQRVDEEDHIDVAVRLTNCAIELNKIDLTWPNGDHLSFRVGMHVGPIVAGILGSERMQYDVWGDTVNVASRMESSSEPGRIHVSKTFADVLTQRLPDTLSIHERGTVDVKGKGPMTTYWLESSP